MSKEIKAHWRVHTPNLLGEIMVNPDCYILKVPLNIFARILMKVADRAIKLDDPELNQLMTRLALYSIGDPESPDYDEKATHEILSKHY